MSDGGGAWSGVSERTGGHARPLPRAAHARRSTADDISVTSAYAPLVARARDGAMIADGFDRMLSAAKVRDGRAWRQLFETYAGPVAGYMRVQGADDVDDLVSEVFIGVLRNIGSFEGTEAQFRSWVFVIAHHRLVDQRRRRARVGIEPRAELPDDGLGDDLGPAGTEQIALDRLGTADVVAMCSQLAPDQRDVLMLRIVGDLTIEQIASAIGKSLGAVKALQRRGLAALQRTMSMEAVPR